MYVCTFGSNICSLLDVCAFSDITLTPFYLPREILLFADAWKPLPPFFRQVRSQVAAREHQWMCSEQPLLRAAPLTLWLCSPGPISSWLGEPGCVFIAVFMFGPAACRASAVCVCGERSGLELRCCTFIMRLVDNFPPLVALFGNGKREVIMLQIAENALGFSNQMYCTRSQ